MPIKHLFASGKADGADATKVRPSNWNADHDLPVTTKGDLMVATGADTVVRRAVGANGQVLTAESAEADGVKWATPVSPGLMLIEEKVLAVDTASFDFTAIPATYNHLLLEIQCRGTAASTNVEARMRFNGDAGLNYDYQHIQGTTAASAAEVLATSHIRVAVAVAGGTAPAGLADPITIRIPNYRRTTFQKGATAQSGGKRGTATGDVFSNVVSGWWRNTAAINQVTILPDSGNWLAGSVAMLYGLK